MSQTERVDVIAYQEESTDNSCDKFDHTKDRSRQEGGLLASDANNLEEVMRVDCDRRAARPACQKLRGIGKEQAVRVTLDAENLADHAFPAHTRGSLLLLVVLALNAVHLFHDVWVCGLHASELAEVGHGFLWVA